MRIIGIHNVSLSASPLRWFSLILLFIQTAKVFLKLAHALAIHRFAIVHTIHIIDHLN